MQNRKNIVSVIVPVYNSKNTIERCVRSIKEQTYKDIEIIVVNDGSNDGTKQLLEKIIKNDNNIKLINKQNSGPSETRNIGIKEASGDFLMFVDSDDWIEKDAIEKMINIIKNYKVDIVRCNYNFFYCNSKIKKNNILEKYKLKTIFSSDELLDSNFFKSNLWYTVWGQLIKRECIHGIYFDIEKKIGEDLLFNINLYKKAFKIYFLNQPLYIYNFNPNGITKMMTEENLKSNMFEVIDNYLILYETFKDTDTKKIISNKCVKAMLSYTLQLIYLTKNKNYVVNLFDYVKRNEKIKSFILYYNDKKYIRYIKYIKKGYINLFFLRVLLIYVPLKKIKNFLQYGGKK